MRPKQPKLAQRMGHIEPFHVMDLLAKARQLEAQGRDIVHMEIGEPDFSTPAPVVAAGIRALKEGRTHYTPALGLTALREAIADYYQTQYGVSIPPQRVVVTPGSSGALQLIMAALVDPGSQVLMADPGYPCNRHFVHLFEGDAIGVPVGPQSSYQLTAADLLAHWQPPTVAALLATPSNPTGTLVSTDTIAEMAQIVAERKGRLIVDEIYLGLSYDQPVSTALEISDEIIVINSFSKFFGMTGWRIGWMVVPEELVRPIDKLAQNIFLATSTPAQYAALAAFNPAVMDELESRRLEFKARRDYLLPALRELGFNIPVTPQGAFYLYADCRSFGEQSTALAARLLDQAGVAVTPGIDFGSNAPEHHLRFAYTTAIDRLQEGVGRLREALANG